MASTFARYQVMMGRRVGPAVGLADIHEAVAYALGTLGRTPLDPLRIVDADITAVSTQESANQLVDVTEWRMLEAILNNLTDEELLKVGVTTPADKLEPILRRRAERLAAWIKTTYGVGVATATLDVINWNFQQGRDCPPRAC